MAEKPDISMKCLAATLLLAVGLSIAPINLAPAQSIPATAQRSTITQPPLSLSRRFDRLSKEAAQARDQNRPDTAIRLYREALELKPSWAEGWWDLGALLYEADRYEEARETFHRLVNLKPEGGPGWAMLGLCEFEIRKFAEALQHLQHGQRLGVGDNPELISVAQYHLAILYTRFEQYEAGTKMLLTMARAGNESPSLIEALGLSVLRMPFLPSEMPPDRREMVVMAGRAAYDMRMHRPMDGKNEFEELIARYPETPNMHYAYGTFLLNTDPDAALRELDREIQISPSHVPARLQIVFEDIKRKDFVAGLPLAEKAVELAPQLFAAHYALGRVLLGLSDTARAVSELETAVKLAPDSPEVRFALYTAYSRAGRKEEAERARAEFLRLDKLRKN